MPLGDTRARLGAAAVPAAMPCPAFETIYATQFSFVWRCLRGLGVEPSLLDDAAHDVFLVVHRKLGDVDDPSWLRSWVYAIVRRVAASYRRSERRRQTSELDETFLESPRPTPHELLADREAADFVSEFMTALDAPKRDVFVLALLEGLAIPQVSEILNIPLGTAYTRLRAVRSEFERALRRKRVRP
jgi:RNA polymerase sigma-70 factor, ECF subfamily